MKQNEDFWDLLNQAEGTPSRLWGRTTVGDKAVGPLVIVLVNSLLNNEADGGDDFVLAEAMRPSNGLRIHRPNFLF